MRLGPSGSHKLHTGVVTSSAIAAAGNAVQTPETRRHGAAKRQPCSWATGRAGPKLQCATAGWLWCIVEGPRAAGGRRTSAQSFSAGRSGVVSASSGGPKRWWEMRAPSAERASQSARRHPAVPCSLGCGTRLSEAAAPHDGYAQQRDAKPPAKDEVLAFIGSTDYL